MDNDIQAGGDEHWHMDHMSQFVSGRFDLERGQSRTVIAPVAHLGRNGYLTSADIDFILVLRPFAWFPWKNHRTFHFIGGHGDNWFWLEQP